MNTQIHEWYRDTFTSTDEEKVPEVLPVEEPPVEADEHTLPGLIELLLKAPARLDQLTRDDARQAELIPRFLAIAVASFSIFGLAMVLLLDHVPSKAVPMVLAQHWTTGIGPAASLWSAYVLGLIAASGICLPSFYFFGLLAGVKISVLQVTGHMMKGKAATAMMLLGILPIYVAIVMGMIVFQAPTLTIQKALYLGLGLPFVAGLWGCWSIYQGFMGLVDTLPPERRCQRGCFLRRLTFSWAVCYSAVTPVMIWTLWNYFAQQLG